MEINWSGDAMEKNKFLHPNLIAQPGTYSQINNNSDTHPTKPATTTINGVVLHFTEDGIHNNDPSSTANGNAYRPTDLNMDENRHFTNSVKKPHAIRRDVSFRQQNNSSVDNRVPNNLVSSPSAQTALKQAPSSISNVTSVERARARALQAVNYYNSSVLGDPTMEPPAQFAGK